MKIVILDGYSVNPGDLSWDDLARLGDLTVYPRTSPDEVGERIGEADIVLTNKVIIDKVAFDAAPRLKYVGVLATGYNVVDLPEASRRGIVVTNIPSYSTDSVAQTVYALLLAIYNRVEYYAGQNRDGRWSHARDFCYWDYPSRELAGKTMGIVGLGHIGTTVARIALAMGMIVKAVTSKTQNELPAGVTKTSIDQLFSESDVVTIHCPLTESTRHLVNAGRLSLMKSSSVLINTSRGPVVDEDALADALNTGKIYAAGIDVMSVEPPSPDNPLLSARNCFITPHIAWATVEARTRLIAIACANVAAFISGSPVNQVNRV